MTRWHRPSQAVNPEAVSVGAFFCARSIVFAMERPSAPCGYADAERVEDIALTQLADMINRNCEHHRFGRGK